MCVTWGASQSLIQLSVALNAVFTAYGTYLGRGIEYEKSEILALLSFLKEKAPPDLDQRRAELERLIGRCHSIDRRLTTILHGIFRIFCIACAIIGVGLLFISAYLYNYALGVLSSIFILAMYLPLLFAIFLAIYVSHALFVQVRKPRLTMEASLVSP